MGTRREFLKKAALLSGAAGAFGALPGSIRRAFAIDPAPGTTCLDAEHIVILMQENRSFDHAYGTLQGVRGFEDPRALRLPNDNLVWLQTNGWGETYAPFRLDMKETKSTWMGSLPHSWTDQVDARNGGKHDKWLEAKTSGHKEYAQMPLTMGYYTRRDLPFYYALADAFTICDQHFCSALTGTMANRLYLWTGTVRGVPDNSAPAKVLNADVEYESAASWLTFPERLEDNGVSWKIYQNELSLDVGFTGEEAAWLANFGDNPLEWFTQYHARFSPAYRRQLDAKLALLPTEIETLRAKLRTLAPASAEFQRAKNRLDKAEVSLRSARVAKSKWTADNFKKLSAREKNLHAKAFSTNQADPFYHELTGIQYWDRGRTRRMKIPKGDVLHQFRRDVESGSLPAVSWIVAPENFSDHPGAAWFGAWYLSEVMDILTRNPGVWRKTIFLLTYDENDGYFDHVPPFVAPHPQNPASGQVSKGLNVTEDYVTLEEELRIKPAKQARGSSIGLGYRVPLVIASPWTRGGYVCSQVFDHTSVLQFLEKFASRKAGKPIQETNISAWRRSVCGDLTSAFRPHHGEPVPPPPPVPKRQFLEDIHRAQYKKQPAGYKALTQQEIDRLNANPRSSPWAPKQEPGTRPSCALPYQLYAEGNLNREAKTFEIVFAAKDEVFGPRSAGSAFHVYAPGRYVSSRNSAGTEPKWELARSWAFTVARGSNLKYGWPLAEFEGEAYHLRVHGPNGFFREFKGALRGPAPEIRCEYQRGGEGLSGQLEFAVTNNDPRNTIVLQIEDNAYRTGKRSKNIRPTGRETIALDLSASVGWYDVTVSVEGSSLAWRYAGRIETGKDSITDPVIGAR